MMNGLTNLCNNVFEVPLAPRLGRMCHHGNNGVVILFVLVVKEHQLRPQMGLLGCPQHLK